MRGSEQHFGLDIQEGLRKINKKKTSPRQGPRRVGVRASHGQSGYAPSGILKVFLVLPEGEKNFIRSPVGDLKRFIAWS